MYSSFSLRALLRMHRLDPVAEVAYLVKKSHFLVFVGRFMPWITSLHLSHKWYFHHLFHSSKHLRLWTVNDERVMKKAFQSNVRAIIPNFKLKLATHKKFTRRLVVQAFFRVIVNPIFDKSDFFRGRFLGSFW